MATNAKKLPAEIPATAITPMDMIGRIVEQGGDVERLERMMDLERRWKEDKAREAYFEALTAFKKLNIVVSKDKHNKQYNSKYAGIGNLVNTVSAAMAPFGLSARWEFDQSAGISVTCTLSHTLGHCERVTMSGPPDTSGAKNSLQQIKSTVTYLESATFQAVTGVISQDTSDDDGNGANLASITEKQASILTDLINASDTDESKFLAWIGAESVTAIPQGKYRQALMQLERKVKQAGEPI